METDIHRLIVNYFSGTISAEDRLILTDWINENEENWKEFQQLKNLWDISHPVFPPEAINAEKALEKVLCRIDPPRWYNHRYMIVFGRVASILILPLLVFFSYDLVSRRSVKDIVAYQEVFCPFGGKIHVILPDSSGVWLNSGTSLRYPVSFSGNERNVLLRGEAFFDVHTDKRHPFIVSMGKGMAVTATGTSFNIEAYEDDSIVAVTMVSGKIKVDMPSVSASPLLPGERMVFNRESSIATTSKTVPGKWCSWKDGTLIFRDDPLSEVFKRLGRIYNMDIVIKDSVIAGQPYRATFEGESLDVILELLELTAPITYKKMLLPDNDHQYGGKQRIEVYKSN